MAPGFTLSLLLPLLAAATPLKKSECPDIDFSPQLGRAAYQGNSNMCHAFVAADLITVNQGIGPADHVSALDVASNLTVVEPAAMIRALPAPTRFGEVVERGADEKQLELVQQMLFDWKTDMRAGLPNLDVLAYNLRPSICTERDLPSQDPGAAGSSDYLFYRVRGTLGTEDPAYHEWRLLNDCGVQASLGMNDFVAFAQAYGRAVQRESDRNLRKACRHPRPLKPMIAHHVNTAVGEAARLAIQQFRKGAVVGIGYDHGVLTGGEADREFSDHASTLVGSRWNFWKQRCEIKLRNSKGTGCTTYRKDWPCKDGNLWIPAEAIDQMTTALFYIEPQR